MMVKSPVLLTKSVVPSRGSTIHTFLLEILFFILSELSSERIGCPRVDKAFSMILLLPMSASVIGS